jgi:hypothetical protein
MNKEKINRGLHFREGITAGESVAISGRGIWDEAVTRSLVLSAASSAGIRFSRN